MKIAGMQRCSFVDYPGKLCAAVFTAGCNLDCFYCHNRGLIPAGTMETGHAAVLQWLATRRGLLEGVTVSGGEPTLQPDLPGFLAAVRNLGFAVKLDTNGTRPNVLRAVIDRGLVDYVAMDVKAPPESYDRMTGRANMESAITRSIDILLSASVPHEFRTTFAPPLETGDIIAIARRIAGADLYVLQQYRRPAFGAPGSQPRPHPDSYIEETLHAVDQLGLVVACDVRGIDRPRRLVAPVGTYQEPLAVPA